MEPDSQRLPIAGNLRALRRARRVSLQTVADAVKVSKPHIWELEVGRSDNPGIKLVVRLAAYYGVSVAELIGERGPE